MNNRFLFAISIILIFNSFGIFVGGCSSDVSDEKDTQKQISLTPNSVSDLPQKSLDDTYKFKYPYNEKGQFIFASDKEFHQKDCAGYRSHYGIEKLTLPCESDNDIHFMMKDEYLSIYIGYQYLDSEKFEYSTRIELSYLFLSDHDSFAWIEIGGATTRNVLAAGNMSIFLWNYQDRRWKNTPELLLCDAYSLQSLYSHSDEVSTFTKVIITCHFLEEAFKMNAIIHNEEVFQVRMTTWGSDEVRHGGSIVEKEHAYYIPTPTFRKDMHKHWRRRLR